MLNVVYGPHDLEVNLAGSSIEEIQYSLRDLLNVTMDADAYVDGTRIANTSTFVAKDGIRVEFMQEFGHKSILTPEQLASLGLPEEVSVGEAAQILGCDERSVLAYMKGGFLVWRNIAPPSSRRATYRITLESVRELRTCYLQGLQRKRPSWCHGEDAAPPPEYVHGPVMFETLDAMAQAVTFDGKDDPRRLGPMCRDGRLWVKSEKGRYAAYTKIAAIYERAKARLKERGQQ